MASGQTSEIIKEIVTKGKKYYSPFFTYIAPIKGFFLEKPAFVVSKKEFKTAVLRNKAKRRARSAFLNVFPKKTYVHGVFLLKKPILIEKLPKICDSLIFVSKN